jgi:pSer/pThr/pTyr-binding forkhead associated (FHA) protein
MTGEQFRALMADADEWLIPLDRLLPGATYLLADQAAGCAYPLKTGLNTVGRMPDNDICLEETVISRRHCVLLVHAWGGCELHDTASRNGTFVNGARVVRPVRLTSGDSVRLANRDLLFVAARDCEVEEYDAHPETAVL